MSATLGMGPDPTTADYFALLRDHAIAAGQRGNYAISAALVIREGGCELRAFASNTVFAQRDPSGHAEMNAIRLAQAFAAGEPATMSAEASLSVAEVASPASASTLFTTLEPCPMCTVCLITAGIRRVVIAAEDPPAGALSAQALAALPPMWPALARSLGLEVVFCQSDNPGAVDTHLPTELREQLVESFLKSRCRLDETLGDGGVLDVDAIRARAADLGLGR